MARDAGTLLPDHVATCIAERAAAGVGAVQGLVTELRIADPCGSGPQIANIALAVDAEHAEAHFKDGVLTLSLPKAESIRPKNITVVNE